MADADRRARLPLPLLGSRLLVKHACTTHATRIKHALDNLYTVGNTFKCNHNMVCNNINFLLLNNNMFHLMTRGADISLRHEPHTRHFNSCDRCISRFSLAPRGYILLSNNMMFFLCNICCFCLSVLQGLACCKA